MGTPTVPGRCPLCPAGTPSSFVAQGPDFEYGTVNEEFRFVACICGTYYLDPRPDDAVIPNLYPANYEPYLFNKLPVLIRYPRDLIQGRKVAMILRMVPPGGTVLDLGCGVGGLLHLLRRKAPPETHLIGWDFPGEHLRQLAAAGFEIIEQPIELDFAPHDIADVVILNQVLEHFARPDDLLTLIRKVLRPGGILIIETPNTDGIDARLFRRRSWGGYHFPRHLVLFNTAGLPALVEQAGFEVLMTERLVSPAFWNQSLHHFFSDRCHVGRIAPFFSIRNPVMLSLGTILDLVIRYFGPTSNQRLIARLSP